MIANSRIQVAEILMKLPKVPVVFTVEMHDGTKHRASLSILTCIWLGFETIVATQLITPGGIIFIDLYYVKNIY